jgi:hypothetical protein
MDYLYSRQARRFLLTTFFLSIRQLGGPFFDVSLSARFINNTYWKTRRLAVIPSLPYKASLYNIFSYLQAISNVHCSLVVLGYANIDSETFFSSKFSELWGNYFITGMESRFANFLNWHKIGVRDYFGRSPNRRRFHTPLWWVHYKEFGADDSLFQDVGALVIHQYYFRKVVAQPRIFLNKTKVRRDFFVPLPQVAERLYLFSFIYMFLRIFLYHRSIQLASRLFWDTRFLVHGNRSSVDLPHNVFKFAFTLHGRLYDKMQLWEYASFLESFVAARPLATQLAAEEAKYDPKN